MNVLSLFDGISCGLVALKRAGIKVDNYYASEIDKWAIQTSEKNYPEIVRLGDIENCPEWNLPKIDMIIGGPPCQGFSMAGKRLNWDDPRSQLFYKAIELIHDLKPKYFLIENVRMKKEIRKELDDFLGVESIEINSALVSAQYRNRLYWTNIEGIEQPKDKGLVLKDIIEDGAVDRDKTFCLDANYFKGGNLKSYFEKHRRQLVFSGCALTGEADIKTYDLNKRTYGQLGKCPTVRAGTGGHHEPKMTLPPNKWRKLTPLECERLQTLPDDYTFGVSNTQRYKSIGNGWTVDVIVHIFNRLKEIRDGN